MTSNPVVNKTASTIQYDNYRVPVAVQDLGIGAMALAVYNVLLRFQDASGGCFPGIETIGEILGERSLDESEPTVPVSRPTIRRAIRRLEDFGLLTVTRRKGPDGKHTSNLYHLLPVPKPSHGKNFAMAGVDAESHGKSVAMATHQNGQTHGKNFAANQNPELESISMSNTVRQNLLLQIPEAQKEEEDLISADSRTFWDMFTKRHQTIFGHPYNGPAVEMDTHPTLRTLQALDAAERFEIVHQGLKAMAAAGQTGKIGSWSLYETEIQRAIDDYAARQRANQVISMFTLNLNEALVRCHLPVMTGTFTQAQRQEIAARGTTLDADDLERAIMLYAPTHPTETQPFMIAVKLNWVIKTAWQNKQASASNAAPSAKNGNGNGNGTHNSKYRNGAAGNRASGRSQSSSQPAIDWDAAHERIEALYK